jgi:predicted DNA-binding transcriptional regulator YafY
MGSNNRIIRITAILYKLLYAYFSKSNEFISSGTLSDSLGVKPRTIQRDLEIINYAGVPICRERTDEQGGGNRVYLI